MKEDVTSAELIRSVDNDGKPFFYARDPRRPGCMSDGPTEFEALAWLEDARRGWDAECVRLGRELPYSVLA